MIVWVPFAITIICIVALLTFALLERLRRTEPAIGTPVYTAHAPADSHGGYDDRSAAAAVAAQMMKGIRNAGYTPQQGCQSSVMLVMRSNKFEDMATLIAKHNEEGDSGDSGDLGDSTAVVWVVVYEKHQSQLHLGKALNFDWCARKGGPEYKPSLVLTELD